MTRSCSCSQLAVATDSKTTLTSNPHNVIGSFRNEEASRIDTSWVSQGLVGDEGCGLTTNYLGTEVLSAWTRADIGAGIHWSVCVDQSKAERLAAVEHVHEHPPEGRRSPSRNLAIGSMNFSESPRTREFRD